MSFALTSPFLQRLLAVIAIAVPLLAVWSARRLQTRGRALRIGGLWSLVALSQVAAILAVLVWVNDQNGLYATWNDLLGTTPAAATAAIDPAPTTATAASVKAVPWSHGVPAGFQKAGINTFYTTVRMQGSSSPQGMFVVLPPQYFEKKYAKTQIPVLELFHGYPGTPHSWLYRVGAAKHLAAAVAKGGTPFILVVPKIMVAGAPDLECMNLPHQPQMQTFLIQDIRQIITSHFRARTDRSGWGIVGYSEGGYCAAQYALRFPDLFAAAVDIAGYPRPESPYFAKLPKSYAEAGDLALLLKKKPNVALLVTESAQNRRVKEIMGSVASFSAPTEVATVVWPTGGHNFQDFAKEVTHDFLWISKHMATV